MLFRFSLYGFLKNQRYFEPFFILALLEKGLSFLQIGILVTVRELTCVLLEIPSGAFADVCGRRLGMVLSFVAYLCSFIIMGLSQRFDVFLWAMALFGVGEAFRTGTHKAMIFSWLRRQGREAERTRVYGFTRSWSKLGSALCGLFAAGFVYLYQDYQMIFFAAAVPCVLSIVNLATYPAYLEGNSQGRSARQIVQHLRTVLGRAVSERNQRQLILESMGYEGTFAAIKDYLQPVLALMALSLLFPQSGGFNDVERTALLVGPIYCLLFLLSAAASRAAHRLVRVSGSHARAALRLWQLQLLLFITMGVAGWFGVNAVLVIVFVVLSAAQNLWRPILISRFDACSREEDGATLLSIESQGKRVATMVLAPLCGLVVDLAQDKGGTAFWPLGLIGALIAVVFVMQGVLFKRAAGA